MRRQHSLATLIFIMITIVDPDAFGQGFEHTPLEMILNAHLASRVIAADTVKIVGVSTRVTGTQSLTISATSREEILVEIGTAKEVATPARFFKDDGEKPMLLNTPAGFTQLDVTGVFLISRLKNRQVKTGTPLLTTFRGADAWRIHVEGNRSELHHRQLRVKDEFDLYVDKAGMLLAIERTFYEELPLFRSTMTLVFSDHRATSEGPILPHRIERYVKDHKVETILVTSYAFDIQTTRDQFEPRRPRR